MKFRWFSVPIVVALLVGVPVAPATADSYPVDYFPDRGTHTYCFDSSYPLSAPIASRAHYTMDSHDGVAAQTGVPTQFYASCSAPIDVWFQERRIGENVYGYAPCQSWNESNYCDRRWVEVGWGEIREDATRDFGYAARHTLCHEVGHTLGVRHYSSAGTDSPDGTSQSCMRSGIWDTGAAAYRSYGAHHRAHIRGWF